MFYTDEVTPTNEEILDLAADINHLEDLIKDLVQLDDMELNQETFENLKYVASNMEHSYKTFEFYKQKLTEKYSLK